MVFVILIMRYEVALLVVIVDELVVNRFCFRFLLGWFGAFLGVPIWDNAKQEVLFLGHVLLLLLFFIDFILYNFSVLLLVRVLLIAFAAVKFVCFCIGQSAST